MNFGNLFEMEALNNKAAEGLTTAASLLKGFASDGSRFLDVLIQSFSAAGTDPFDWGDAAGRLQAMLADGDFELRVELLNGSVMGQAMGAYAANGPEGHEVIYLNTDWLATANAADITSVVLEEAGHAFDRFLNGALESPGDEGHLFASLMQGIVLSDAEIAAIRAEDDSSVFVINGRKVAVEMASHTVTSGTQSITDIGGTDTLQVDAGATANVTVASSWTADSSSYNNGTANISTAGFTVNLSGITTGSNGFSVTNTSSTGTTLTGSALADSLTGGTGADILAGGAGNDILTGGTGIDTYIVNAGSDTITDFGNGGGDILQVGTGAAVTATITAVWIATAATANNGTATLITSGLLVNLNAVTTGSNGFIVTNTGLATIITGSDLNDSITGGTGNDTLKGHAGDDSIYGQGGNDTINAGPGNDSIYGDAGNDIIMGGLGVDTFIVSSGNDSVSDLGTGGADSFQVSSGATLNAYVTAAAWTATSATANYGIANINSKGYAVDLSAETGTNGYTLSNSGAAASLTGSAHNDSLTGGIGNDSLNGGDGADSLTGGAGDDTLDGGQGNDRLTGGTGIDIFIVNAGSDTVTDLGAGGADILQVGTGASVTASVTAAWTASTDTFNNGTATLSSVGYAVDLAAIVSGTGGYSLTNTGRATTLTGSRFNDSLSGGSGSDSLNGAAGNDTLNGRVGADTLSGGADSDTFLFTTGDSGQTATTLDKISDYSKAAVGTGDLIDFSATLTIGGSSATATATQASIDQTTGIATFAAGSGTTLADALSDIATRFTAATNTPGEFALFEVNGAGDYYAFISDGIAGVNGNDEVIQLVGVTSVCGIDLTGGNLTITG